MAAVRPEERGGTVVVRLSEIPYDLREREVDTLVKKLELRGFDAIMFKLRAMSHDAALEVPAEKAVKALAGKRIAGPLDPYLLGPTAGLYLDPELDS